MKKFLVFLLSLLLFIGISASAHATVIFNDWSLNVDGIEGQTGQIDNINQILFSGVAWSKTDDKNSNGIPDPGEVGFTHGLLTSLTHSETGGGTSIWGFELTFDFSINSIGTNPATGKTFTHLAAGTDVTTLGADASFQTDGLLKLYLDANLNSNMNTGDGYTDGTHIATFAILAGDGGSFTPTERDGSDDGTYELVWALDNVILDADGNDLQDTIGSADAVTIAVTDTNFDGDDNANNNYDSLYASNLWGNPGVQSSVNFHATQDGSASLGVVPEPTTLILLGFGLIGLAGIGRKKQK